MDVQDIMKQNGSLPRGAAGSELWGIAARVQLSPGLWTGISTRSEGAVGPGDH